MKTINCDVVVVGAGPGGSMAARTCAKYGLDTVLVERKEEPGRPATFTWIVDRRLFDYIQIKREFATPIYRLVHTSQDGTQMCTPYHDEYELCYEVDRKVFDREILKLALKEGPEYMNKTRATGLIKERGQIKGIKAKIDEKEDIEIRSNLVIGADGVESKIGKWAGIYNKSLGVRDLFIVLDSLLDNVDTDEEESHTWYRYYGYKDFPKVGFSTPPRWDGKRSFAVTSIRFGGIPKKEELFAARNYMLKNNPLLSKAKTIEMGCGVVPVNPLKNYTADGVMLVGDAAHQVNMPHGAGIIHAMDAGILSGEVAVEAQEEGDFSSNFLSKYEKRCYKLFGEKDRLGYYIFKEWTAISTDDFNRRFRRLADNDGVFSTEYFEETFKSASYMSKLFNTLEDGGIEINDFLSYASILKKYHRNFWDTFIP